jgi:hypothetical protein
MHERDLLKNGWISKSDFGKFGYYIAQRFSPRIWKTARITYPESLGFWTLSIL